MRPTQDTAAPFSSIMYKANQFVPDLQKTLRVEVITLRELIEIRVLIIHQINSDEIS